MDKIFQQAKDKNVAALLIYVDANGYACSDAAAEVKMTKAQLMDAFLKRAFIVGQGSYMVPSELIIDDNYAAVVVTGLGTSGANITVYSGEYTA